MDTGDARQAGFNAAEFRSAINFAMQMGLPGTVSERVTFQWTPSQTYNTPNSRGRSYNIKDAPASEVTAADVVASLTVPVSVEFRDTRSSSGDTPMGDFDITRIKIQMLDTSYALLNDANLGLPDKVLIDGNTYVVNYWAPPIGLFDVSFYEVYAEAVDES